MNAQVAPFDENIAPWQIRLVSPAVCPITAQRLMHLLVLRRDGVESYLAAPFGRFSTPALPGELRLDGPAPALRLLALWNSRLLPAALLGQSWVVAELDPSLRDDCLAVYENIQQGTLLPECLRQRVGPPLVHALDPRHEYRAEEVAAMDMLMKAGSAGSNSISYTLKPPVELRKAAEERGDYGDPQQNEPSQDRDG